MNRAHWTTALLGSVATINMGQSPPSSTVNSDGPGMPFVQGNAEFGPRSPRPVKYCSKPQKQARPGDILLSVRAPVGALNLAEESLCIGRGLSAITATGVNSVFLWHALRREVPRLARVSQGSTFAAVNKADLYTLQIPLPSPSEQRQIAAILSSVDDAIEKTQAVIDQVQVVKRGLMQELLTRGLPGRHTRFKKTEIGEIPEEWNLHPAATVCERIVVGIVIKPAQHYKTSGVPCLRSLNVKEDQISNHEMKYISHESNHQLRKSQLRSGDVVTVRTGYPGTSAVIPERLNGANCVDVIISTPGPRIRGAFLSRFVNSERGRAVIAEQKGGLAQQHFNVGAMKAMPTPIPSLQEQDQICDVLQSPDHRLNAETEHRQGLLSLKAALMSVLLTGQLRVTPDTVAA